MKQEQEQLKHGISTEISLDESMRHSRSMSTSIAWSLKCRESLLQASLDEIRDTLTFFVIDFPQLKKMKNVWCNPPFVIAKKVRVHISVQLSGFGRGQVSCMSLSLILVNILTKAEHMSLEYSMSFAVIGQYESVPSNIMELCTYQKGENVPPAIVYLSKERQCTSDNLYMWMLSLHPTSPTQQSAAIRGAVSRSKKPILE